MERSPASGRSRQQTVKSCHLIELISPFGAQLTEGEEMTADYAQDYLMLLFVYVFIYLVLNEIQRFCFFFVM